MTVPRPALKHLLARALLGLGLLVLGLAPAAAASFTASVDHALLSTRETFDYVLSLAGAGEAQAPPDVSGLARDFEIVSRSRRERTDRLDGRPVSVQEWVTTLAPRRPGLFTLPGVTVNGLSSGAVKVQVVPAIGPEETGEQSLFARVDAGDVAPYAQGVVPVVVRVFDGVGIRGGGFASPTAEGGTLTPEGTQRTYVRAIGKRHYTVIEQSYLLQPQKSGRIEIDPVPVAVTLPGRPSQAAVGIANLLGRLPFSTDPGEDLKLTTRPVSIEVKPRPDGAEGWFLPARAVSLTQSWSADPAKAKPGVALTRTLRLKARGAGPNQLPTLPVTEVDGVRQYEDASRTDRITIDGESGAELVQTLSVVPTRAGRITLPAITVGWWNTDAGRQEQVGLPPVVIDVANDASPPVAAGTAGSAGPPAPTAGPDLPEMTGLREMALRHGWLLAATIAVALVGGLGAASVRRRRAARARAESTAAVPAARPARSPHRRATRAPVYADAAAAERALGLACRAGDATAAHAAFLAWLRLSAGDGGAGLRTAPMKAALRDLSLALYGAEGRSWRGRDFLAAFSSEKRARRRVARGARQARIAPLYPTG